MSRTLVRATIAVAATLGLSSSAALAVTGTAAAQGVSDPVHRDDSVERATIDQTATEQSGSDPRPPVSEDILRAMKRDLNLDRQEALDRIVSDRDAADTERRLRTELGHEFAGAWIDEDGGLRVATTAPPPSDAFERIATAGAIPIRAEHDAAELERALTRLDNAPRPDTRVTGWYVDVARNTVVVRTLPGGRSDAETLVQRADIEPDLVRIERHAGAPRPLYDVRGGDLFHVDGASRCSIGFSVEGGFVTAGHCLTAGASISGHNGVQLGRVAGTTFPGGDHGWVRITNDAWVARPWVNNYAGGSVTVRGSEPAPVGAQVCRSGAGSGWACETIEVIGQTVNYPGGVVYDLTRVTGCAAPGDSGGAWVAGDQAQGVTSGGSGHCDPSSGSTYFQPVNPILDAYGLTLLTGGGDGQPPSGTWEPNTDYVVGDQVRYDGVDYRCVSAHTSLPGWQPSIAPVYWQPL